MLDVQPVAIEFRFAYTFSDLIAIWPRLHALDNHPLPDAKTLQHAWQHAYSPATDWTAVSDQLLQAWLAFHNGCFDQAYQQGQVAGPAGIYVAHLAVNSHGAYQLQETEQEAFFSVAVQASKPKLNAQAPLDHLYIHALNLGRYADTLPTARAVSSGALLQFKKSIEQCLKIAPHHIPSLLAHAALMSEVIATLGDMPARLTFGTSSKKVLGYYQQASKLADPPPVVYLEHAKGLHKLDARRNLSASKTLLEKALQAPVLDSLDRFDQREAQQLLAQW